MHTFFTDISVIEDLEVGSHLSDHLQVSGLVFSSNLSEPIKSLRENIQDYIHGLGDLAEALNSEGMLFYKTSLEEISDYPDMEITFRQGNFTDNASIKYQKWKPEVAESLAKPNHSSAFGISVSPLRTYSLGTVRLRSSDPYEYPLIDANILSDPDGKDMRLTYEGIQFSLNLVKNSQAFKAINATLAMKPINYCSDFEFLTKDYWYCAIKYITAHNNHPVSTCRMGPNPSRGDVVDSQLRVYGIRKLRVADASVIPLSTSSHISSICMMIGEKVADLLKIAYRET